MKVNCKVIQDLIPLYIDGILSEESEIFVEEHISKCKSCKLSTEQTNFETANSGEAAENLRISNPFKRLKSSRRKALFITLSISILLFFLCFAVFLPYVDPLLSTYDELLGISQTDIISAKGYTKSLKKLIAEKEEWDISEIECKTPFGVMYNNVEKNAFGFDRLIIYQDIEYFCHFLAKRNIFGVYKITDYDIATYDKEKDIWVFKYSGETFVHYHIPQGH